MMGLGFYDREAVEARREEMRRVRSRSATTPITIESAGPARTAPQARVAQSADPAEESQREVREKAVEDLQRDLKAIRAERAEARRAMVNLVACGGGLIWSGLPEETLQNADPKTTRQAAVLVASLHL